MPIPAIDISYLVNGQIADADPDVKKPLTELQQGVNDVLAGDIAFEQLNLGEADEVTIASGVITVTLTHHTIDTEANAASDELDSIDGEVEGDVLVLRLESAARLVTVKHNTGNIYFADGNDFELDDENKSLILFYNGTKWTNVNSAGSEPYNPVKFVQTQSVTVQNQTAAGTLLGTGVGSATLAANSLLVGDMIRITAMGLFSRDSNSLSIRVYMGATTLLDSGTIAFSSSDSNLLWHFDCLITVRSLGATGTVYAMGHFVIENLFSDTGLINGGTTTVDTTAANAMNLEADWVAASAGNVITCTNLTIEVLRPAA